MTDTAIPVLTLNKIQTNSISFVYLDDDVEYFKYCHKRGYDFPKWEGAGYYKTQDARRYLLDTYFTVLRKMSDSEIIQLVNFFCCKKSD